MDKGIRARSMSEGIRGSAVVAGRDRCRGVCMGGRRRCIAVRMFTDRRAVRMRGSRVVIGSRSIATGSLVGSVAGAAAIRILAIGITYARTLLRSFTSGIVRRIVSTPTRHIAYCVASRIASTPAISLVGTVHSATIASALASSLVGVPCVDLRPPIAIRLPRTLPIPFRHRLAASHVGPACRSWCAVHSVVQPVKHHQ
jgi:hypothetical protein